MINVIFIYTSAAEAQYIVQYVTILHTAMPSNIAHGKVFITKYKSLHNTKYITIPYRRTLETWGRDLLNKLYGCVSISATKLCAYLEGYTNIIHSNISRYCTQQGDYHIHKSMHNKKSITIPYRRALQTWGSDLQNKLYGYLCVRQEAVRSLHIICHLTHWGRDKMAAISQTTFSNGFSWMKMYGFWLTFHWSLFLGVQLTIFQHWFR